MQSALSPVASLRSQKTVNYLAAQFRILKKKAKVDELMDVKIDRKEFDEDLNFLENKLIKIEEMVKGMEKDLMKTEDFVKTLKKHVITMAVSAAAEVASVTITKAFDIFSKDIAKEIEEKNFAVDMKFAEVKEDCKLTRHIQHVTFTRMFGDDY